MQCAAPSAPCSPPRSFSRPGSRASKPGAVKYTHDTQSRPQSSRACCSERGVAWAPGDRNHFSVIPSDLPAVLPSSRVRSSASCRGKSPRIQQKEVVDVSSGMNTMYSGLQKVWREAGRLRSSCASPSVEHDFTTVLHDQLREQLGSYQWLTHALTERGSCATQARVEAARSLHKWRAETARLAHVVCGGDVFENEAVGNVHHGFDFGVDVDVDLDEDAMLRDAGRQMSFRRTSKTAFACECGGLLFAGASFCAKCGSRSSIKNALAWQDDEAEEDVLMHEPEKRGVSACQFQRFFTDFCGDMIYESGEDAKPICIPSKLAELCVQTNLADAKRGLGNTSREPNMYSVTELVIIPQTGEQNISYAERLNPNGLLIDFFLSHHWGEDFGEFTQGVLRHAMFVGWTSGGKPWTDTAYWCCSFANNQHVADLGENIERSPFFIALASPGCRGTVMNLTQSGSALSRLWCVYEVYLTNYFEKPLTLNSSYGPLSDFAHVTEVKDLRLAHVFRLLQHINTEDAAATREEDHRQLMRVAETCHNYDGLSGIVLLDAVLKSLVAEQAIFTLARRGDASAIHLAIDMQADPNTTDANGVRPLTYAVANQHLDAADTLISRGADAQGATGACEVLAMWAVDPTIRKRAFKALQSMKPETFAFHSMAYHAAKADHERKIAAALITKLDSNGVDERLTAVRGLTELSASALAMQARKLAPCLGDADARVRQAAVDAFGAMGELLDVHRSGICHGTIPEDHLGNTILNTGNSVVHLAANEETGNAFCALVYGVDWPTYSPALRAVDTGGRTVAHLAALNGHTETLKLLLRSQKLASATLTVKDGEGRNALHHVVGHGNAEKLRDLYEFGNMTVSDLEETDHCGRNVAHIAAERNHAECLSALVSDCRLPHRALTAFDRDGRNTAHIAAAHGSAECLRVLITKLRIPRDALAAGDSWHLTPAHVAVMVNSTACVSTLKNTKAPVNLLMGPEVPAIGAVALVNRLPSGDTSSRCVSSWRLGRVYYGPDHQGKMKFEYHGGGKSKEFVKWSRCVFAPTPLVLAEKLNHEEAEALLKADWESAASSLTGTGAKSMWKMARKGILPAGALASLGQAAMLREMVSRDHISRANFLEADIDGAYPLHRAASSGSAIAVQCVVELGNLSDTDLIQNDSQGRNALHWAAESNSPSCLYAVFKAFGSIHSMLALTAGDHCHRTPVHIAAAADSADALIALEELGAPLDARMGSPIRETGALVLVKQGGFEARIGTVSEISNDLASVTVKFENGSQQGAVPVQRCIFAPTPLDLAEAFSCARTATVLRKRLGLPAQDDATPRTPYISRRKSVKKSFAFARKDSTSSEERNMKTFRKAVTLHRAHRHSDALAASEEMNRKIFRKSVTIHRTESARRHSNASAANEEMNKKASRKSVTVHRTQSLHRQKRKTATQEM